MNAVLTKTTIILMHVHICMFIIDEVVDLDFVLHFGIILAVETGVDQISCIDTAAIHSLATSSFT